MRRLSLGWNTNLTLVSYFLFNFAYWGLYYLLGNLYLLRLGHDVTFVGQANSVGFLVYCVLSFPAGFLARRWGPRRSMLVGASVFVVFFASFVSVELLSASLRTSAIIACMIPGGAGGALYMACVNPYLMETESSRRAAALSAGAMVSLVACALGNLAGGLLTGLSSRLTGAPESSPAPYRLGLVVAIAVQLGCVASILLMRRAPAPAAGGDAREARQPEPPTPVRAPTSLLVVAVAAGTLAAVFNTSVQTFFSLHLDQTFRVPTQSIGAVMAVARGIPALAFILAPLLARRYGAYRTAVFATAASVFAAAAIGLATRWVAAAVGYTLMSFVSALGTPATSLLYQEAVDAPARPVVEGVRNAAYGLGGAAILFSGGYAISRLGYGRFFTAGVAALAVGTAVFAIYFGARARRRTSAAAT